MYLVPPAKPLSEESLEFWKRHLLPGCLPVWLGSLETGAEWALCPHSLSVSPPCSLRFLRWCQRNVTGLCVTPGLTCAGRIMARERWGAARSSESDQVWLLYLRSWVRFRRVSPVCAGRNSTCRSSLPSRSSWRRPMRTTKLRPRPASPPGCPTAGTRWQRWRR